jgi:multidrug efflux pump subunit AcrA (membrane-fusion protein)
VLEGELEPSFIGLRRSTVTEVSLQVRLIMTELNERRLQDQCDAQARIAEITRLFGVVRHKLEEMIDDLGADDLKHQTSIIAKLNELHTAHLSVLAAEEAHDAQAGKPNAGQDIDLDALRAEIGSQLDRLRAAITSDSVSDGAECCPACGTAASV